MSIRQSQKPESALEAVQQCLTERQLLNKSPFQTRLSKDNTTRSQKVLQPPVSSLNVVSENTLDEEDPVINAAQYSATKAKKEPIVKKIQTHV